MKNRAEVCENLLSATPHVLGEAASWFYWMG